MRDLSGTGQVYRFTLSQLLKSNANRITLLLMVLLAAVSMPLTALMRGESPEVSDTSSLTAVRLENRTALDLDFSGDSYWADTVFSAGAEDPDAVVTVSGDVTGYQVAVSGADDVDQSELRLLADAVQTAIRDACVRAAGLTAQQLAQLEGSPLPEENFDGSRFWVQYGYSILAMMVCLMSASYVIRAVVEEKDSRLVELLLVSVKPMALLAGKILAVMAFTFGWLLAMLAGFGVSCGLTAALMGSDALHRQLSGVLAALPQAAPDVWHLVSLLAVLLVSLALGYLTMSIIGGVAGACCSGMEEAGEATGPVMLRAGKNVAMITEGDEKGNFICSYEDFLTIAKDYVITATGVYGANYKAAVILNPLVFLPGKPANNTSGYVETTLRSGSYNYRFDWLALTAMGFTMTEDLSKANVIVGSQKLSDEALGAVKAGTPYMAYGATAFMGEGNFLLGLGVKLDSCTMGTDFLGRVVYPSNTLVNASYINEADDVMYEYGTNWFTKIPEGATVLVQNAGKAPLQGCICLTDDELTEEFNQYNNGVVGFEYQSGKLDMALFANVLNHKIHQTDEYTFISNFIFSRSLTETAYEGVAQPENPDPVNPGKPEEPGKPDAPKTGDTSSIIVWVLAASFTVVMIPMTVTLKRKAR